MSQALEERGGAIVESGNVQTEFVRLRQLDVRDSVELVVPSRTVSSEVSTTIATCIGIINSRSGRAGGIEALIDKVV